MAGKAVFLCCISAWIWVPRCANFFQGHDRQPNAQAVDLGTSACKFLLVDETGKVCNQVSRKYPLSMPHTGWSEQDPSSWWQACLDGIPALLEVYATTLHYAPCHTDPANGFKVLVALPKGTNTDKPNMPTGTLPSTPCATPSPPVRWNAAWITKRCRPSSVTTR